MNRKNRKRRSAKCAKSPLGSGVSHVLFKPKAIDFTHSHVNPLLQSMRFVFVGSSLCGDKGTRLMELLDRASADGVTCRKWVLSAEGPIPVTENEEAGMGTPIVSPIREPVWIPAILRRGMSTYVRVWEVPPGGYGNSPSIHSRRKPCGDCTRRVLRRPAAYSVLASQVRRSVLGGQDKGSAG